MQRNLLLTVAATALAATGLNAQSSSMRASIRGNGGNEGKCTIEVVVDGAAEVEVRGDRANLRNLYGQPPQWRRFECNGVMPDRPAEFRFKGIDGRGRQDLVRDPRNGGPAVVRIEDKDGGSEGYTFDLIWRGQGGGGYSSDQRGDFGPDRRGPDFDPRDRDYDRRNRFTTEDAVRTCREEVRVQAAQRFRDPDVRFRRIAIDDNPGRNDWVVGVIDVERGRDRYETYRFACSVNFDNGRVRSVQIDRDDRR